MDPPAGMGQVPGPGTTPGTDMTSISFRDQLWLNTFPLDRALVFDYFALSPFYDRTCSNEQLRMRSIHPLDSTQLRSMTGLEYILHEALEPHLFNIRKQKRDGPEKVTVISAYYILDGSIYQAPQLYSVVSSRAVRALYHIRKAFSLASAKLEKYGHDTESAVIKSDDSGADEVGQKKQVDRTVDFKEVVRIDQILAGVFRRLPPAPPPPPFPVVAPPAEASSQAQAGQQQQSAGELAGGVATEQGPLSKRVKLEKQ